MASKQPSVHEVIKTRHKHLSLRIFCAELFGTALFVFIGNSSMAQVMVGRYELDKELAGAEDAQPGASGKKATIATDVFDYGDILTVAIGYGVGLTMAVVLSGTISGGHLNPAVTVTHVFFKKIHWAILPVYIIAQCFGTFVGMGFAYTLHAHKLSEMEEEFETQFAYFTSPLMLHPDSATLLWDQVVGSAIFMCIFFANEETRSTFKFKPLRAINVGGCYGLLILSIGINAGSAINPARDMVPRIFFYTVGYGGAFTGFAAITFLAPFFGCLLGGSVYQLLIGSVWPDEEEETEETALDDFMEKLKILSHVSKEIENAPRRSSKDHLDFKVPPMVHCNREAPETGKHRWWKNASFGGKSGTLGH